MSRTETTTHPVRPRSTVASRRRRRRRDDGQVTPLVAAGVLLAAGVVLVVAAVAAVLVTRAQAQTAADAAALAAVVEGREGAEDLARRNGARVVAVASAGGDAEVTVAIGPVRAHARARRGG